MKTLDLFWMKKYDWALIGRGEGSQCRVVSGSAFEEELHEFFCVCRKAWQDCCAANDSGILEELKDSDNWAFDEGGLPYSYSMTLEQAGIEIVRVDSITLRSLTF